MASTDAKLRLIIEGQDRTSDVFAGIAKSAESALTAIRASLDNLTPTTTFDNLAGIKTAFEDNLIPVGVLADEVAQMVQGAFNTMTAVAAPGIADTLAKENQELRAEVDRLGAMAQEIKDNYSAVVRATQDAAGAGGQGKSTGGQGSTSQGADGTQEAAKKAADYVDALTRAMSLSRDEAMQFLQALDNLNPKLGVDLAAAAKMSADELSKYTSILSGARVTIQEATRDLGPLEKAMQLQGLSQASQMIEQWGESIVGFLREGISLSAQFESTTVDLHGSLALNGGLYGQMHTDAVKAAEGFTALTGTMGELSDKATELGKAYMFNENQVQEMFQQMASSGIPAQDIMDGVGLSAVQLAQATRSDLVPATNVLTSSYYQLHDSLEKTYGPDTKAKMQGVADVLTNIKLSTPNASLESVASTMKYVGPIANAAGQSFTDLGTSIALLGRNGIDASMAGTALRRMFTNLTPQSDEAAEAMKQLGIITADGANQFFTAEGQMKPMRDIVDILSKSVEGLGDAQRGAALKAIFGQYALQAMTVVARTSGDDFDKLKGVITQTGTSAQISTDQMHTMTGKLDVLGENWTIIKKKIGDALEGALKPLMDVLIKCSESVIAFFQEHPKLLQIAATIAGITGVVLAVAGAIGTFLATIGALSAGITAAMPVLTAIGTAISAISAPVAIVIAAIAALYVAWATNFGGMRDFLNDVWGKVKTDLLAAWNYIAPTLQSAITSLTVFLKQFGADIEKIVKFIIGVLEFFAPVWQAMWTGFKAVVGAAWDSIVAIIRGAFDIIKGIWDVIMGVLTLDWDRFWNGIKEVMSGVWDIIKGVVKGAWDWIAALFTTSIGVIDGIFESFFGFSLVEKFSGWFSAIRDTIARIWNGMVDMAKQWGRNLIDMFSEGIMSRVNALVDKVRNAVQSIKNLMGFSSPTKEGPGSNADQWAPNFMNMFADGIAANRDKVRAAVEGVAVDMRTTVGVGSPGLPASRTAGRQAGSMVFNVTINTNGKSGEDHAREFMDAVRRHIPVVTVG